MWHVGGTVDDDRTADVAVAGSSSRGWRAGGLAADLAAEEVVYGRLGCPRFWLRVQVRHGDELAVGVLGAEGGRPVARQRSAVAPEFGRASRPQQRQPKAVAHSVSELLACVHGGLHCLQLLGVEQLALSRAW